MVLHELHERVDRLPPEVVLAAPGEGVRLVDQQHATERRLEHGAGARRGLADVAGDELRAVGLDEVTLRDDAEGAVDLAEQPGDGGLAGARVAGEHEVVAGLDRRQVALGADLLDPQQAGQPAHSSFTWSSPISSSSSASSSSSGRSGGSSGCRLLVGGREREPAAAATAGWPGRGTPAASIACSSVERKRRWRRSRRATARGRRGRRVGELEREVVVAVGAAFAVAGVGLDEQVEQRARRRATRPCRRASRRSRSRCGVTITGGVSSEPTSSSHARSSASVSRPSASSNAPTRSAASRRQSSRCDSPASPPDRRRWCRRRPRHTSPAAHPSATKRTSASDAPRAV